MTGDSLGIEFTDVIYGVVIGNAVLNLNLEPSAGNLLLIVALVIIMDDWVSYRLSVQMADPTGRNYLMAFVLDMAILVTWYLSTTVDPHRVEIFLAVLGLFFFLQGVWDRAVIGRGIRDLITGAQWNLAAVSLVAAGAIWTVVTDIAAAYVLTGTLAIFVLRRLPDWRRMSDQEVEVI